MFLPYEGIRVPRMGVKGQFSSILTANELKQGTMIEL